MKVYSTLSRKKEDFKPLGEAVNMYVCGVTPYSEAHIGHAMSYINFDVIRRYLLHKGYKLKYVQNYTDIDDKIINRANSLGVEPTELAKEYSDSFAADMKALNVLPADIYPRVTEEVPKIIEVVKGLVDKGYAYEAGGSVYFKVKSMADYGKLSHRSLDQMKAGARLEVEKEKEDPMDFVLWKASKEGEPFWQSPWGKGRPGWHIECSAMALKYLGDTIDIHGGGSDLIFPHHENEIAQSECFTGKPFSKIWMHNGLLNLGSEKMSKSLGNLITIKEALEKYSSDALRVFVLGSHYRKPLAYSEEALEAASKGAERLAQAASASEGQNKSASSADASIYLERFEKAMDDDFNTPQALAVLYDLGKEINKAETSGQSSAELRKTLKELGEVFGLTFEVKEADLDTSKVDMLCEQICAEISVSEAEVKGSTPAQTLDNLITLRAKMRAEKKWQFADLIRDKMNEAGIILEDAGGQTRWKVK